MKKVKRTKKAKSEFSCRLREIRKDQGESAADLARETGVPASKIHYIELKRGEGAPSTHIKLAQALGVSLDEYFGFPTLEPISIKGPEIIKSDPEVTVEQLPPIPRSELSVKRIRVAPHKTVDLTRYLDPRKPAFFYMDQAQGKIWVNQEEHPLIVGNSLGLTLPTKIKVENITPCRLFFSCFRLKVMMDWNA